MAWLAQVALSNAVMAFPLAGLVWLISCYWRRPAVIHTLWVLVLIKLLSPPVIMVPLPVVVSAVAIEHVAEGPARALRTPPSTREWSVGAGRSKGARASSPSDGLSTPSWRSGLMSSFGPLDGPLASAFGLPAPVLTTARVNRAIDLFRVFAWIWLIGAVLRLGQELTRLVRFKRCVASMHEDEQTSRECAAAARQLGLTTFPTVVFFDGVCTPMLWGIGPWLRIIFPRELWEALSPSARQTLLAHELAHYARGDHWVRLLELVIRAGFWWHPVVNWARKEIEIAEEECCDSWVVEAVSAKPRTYAEALLTTLDFIADAVPLTAPACSGVRRVPFLEYRLQQIMDRSGSRSYSFPGRAVIAGVCLFMLPLHPFPNLISLSARASLPAVVQEILPTKPLLQPGTGQPAEKTTASPVAPPVRPPSLRTRTSEYRSVLSPDGRYRLQWGPAGRLFLVNRVTRVRHDLTDAGISAAAFLPGGERFLTGSADGTVALRDSAAGEVISILGQNQPELTSLAVDSLGSTAVTAGRDGSVAVWDLNSPHQRQVLSGEEAVTCVRYSPSGTRVALATVTPADRPASRIVLLDLATLESIAGITLADSAAVLEFVSESEVLAATPAGTLWSCDLLTGQTRPAGTISPQTVSLATFSPNVRLAP